jgi:hypothetical protein
MLIKNYLLYFHKHREIQYTRTCVYFCLAQWLFSAYHWPVHRRIYR